MSQYSEVQCIVVFSYKAQRDDELALQVGDLITNVEEKCGGWWFGKLKNKEGFFPANFVRVQSKNSDFIKGRKCRVKYSYKPVNVDELELAVGQEVELLAESELGWWKGKCGDNIGVFPSTFVSILTSNKDFDLNTSLEVNQNKPRVRSYSTNTSQNINRSKAIPIYVNVFDPEDEPHSPVYGSLSSKLDKECDTQSSLSSSKSKSGFLSRVKQSLRGKGKSLVPKFRASSSASLNESHNSSTEEKRRRNSISAFFKHSSHFANHEKHENFTSKTPSTGANRKIHSSSGDSGIAEWEGRVEGRSTFYIGDDSFEEKINASASDNPNSTDCQGLHSSMNSSPINRLKSQMTKVQITEL